MRKKVEVCEYPDGRLDWGAALTESSAQAYGRRYVEYWETRNLLMVANSREVLNRAPGSKSIAIVGVPRKPYNEAYLHQMHTCNWSKRGQQAALR